MPTMVSRLPKFGSRPISTTASNSGQTETTNSGTLTGASGTRLTNGFYHHPGPAGGTGPTSSLKQNGVIRAPTSFSMKWKKDYGTLQEGGARAEGGWRQGKRGSGEQNRSRNNVHHTYSQRQQESKKLTTVSKGKGRGFVQPVKSSTLPGSKTGSDISKPSQSVSRPSNGFPGSRPRSGTTGSLRQPQMFPRLGGYRPGPGSGSPFQKKLPAARSHSSDGLGFPPTVQLTESNRLRSQSLVQVRPQEAPPIPTPSSSTSRAAERPSSQAPPTGSTTSPVTRPTPGGGVLPPSLSKKPLLPILGPASRPSSISYKLSRPSLFKQACPLLVTPPTVTEEKVGLKSAEFNSTTEKCPEPMSQAEASMVGETLEDMSISSTSSLDRNDISQEEYMDDFDNLGNGGIGILLLSSKNDEDDSGLDQSCARIDKDGVNINGVATATAMCFLDDTVDWATMKLSGEGVQGHVTQLSRHRCSSQPGDQEQGDSSLDLSPSDSCGSDGTYMWDEEGLEPLGGAIASTSINTNSCRSITHHIGSFDSDNSIDVLNNLDSCDLEDDDLMLDADFAEDLSLHSDGDSLSHMAEWRRRQLCWGEHDVHNGNDGDFTCYELTEDPGNKRTNVSRDGDVILDLCSSRTAICSVVAPPPVLGVDVEELVEECSAVRSQLKHLQTLLLQEEDMDEDTLSPEASGSSQSSDTKVQALQQEVLQLREELRSRDRTIAHLTLQMSVPTVTARCHCQETTGRMDRHTQTSVMERESVSSQTSRRRESQILDSSHHNVQEPMMHRVPPPLLSTQLLPPSYRCSDFYAHSNATPESTPENREAAGKTVKERGGAIRRSPRLSQPSKLRLLMPHTSITAPSPKTKTCRPAPMPHQPESSRSSEVDLKTLAAVSGSSRLPSPKTH